MLTNNGYPLNLVKRKMINIRSQRQYFFVPITYHGFETILMTNKIKSMIEKIYPTKFSLKIIKESIR
jgi:hypothetical protein